MRWCAACAQRRSTISGCAPRSSRSAPISPGTAACASPPNLDGDLPTLSPEDELVVYRVAQESLVNVVRHARATRAELSLQAENGAVVLRVRDDGRGIDAAGVRSGTGVRGMRERALLVGADLRVAAVTPHGTEVRLRLPVKGRL